MGKLPAVVHTPVSKPDVLSVADTSQLVQQGRTLFQAGQFSSAANVWRQASDAYQAQRDEPNQAMVLSYLSLTYQQLGRLPQATEAITNSLKLLQTRQSKSGADRLPVLAQALNTQGSLQLAQGQAEQALTTWQQAADTYAQAGDEAGRIGSLINLAQAQQTLGFYLRARKTLVGVEETLQQQQDLQIKTTGLRSLGNIFRIVGDFGESQRVLQQSLAIAQKLGSADELSATLLSLGNSARSQPKSAEAALIFYQKAAAASTSLNTKIQSQLNQLSLLLDAQRWSDAQTLSPEIQSQIAKLPPSQTAVYAQINFAESLARLRQNTTTNTPAWTQVAQIAAMAVQQAKSLDDPRAESYALGSLGGLYEKTAQWSDAQDLTQQALLLSQEINASDITYRWQWQLGRLLKIQGDHSGAIATYTEAVKTLQSLRSDLAAINSEVQFSFREGVEPVYRELVGLLLQSAQGAEPSQDKLEQARKVIESLQLAELDNFFRTACLDATPVQIDTLDQKAAVVYPIILPDRLEIVLSLPQQPLRHYTTYLPQQQVESTAMKLRQFLLQPVSRQFLPLSQQVYNWLIRPAEADLLQGKFETLVFVLDGALRNIPMAALHDGKQYLIEKYAIALTPGLELLKPQPLAQGVKLKALTAGLSEARPGFPALTYVEPELNQIQSQVPGAVLLNQNFTSATLQKEIDKVPFPIVHLATHGQFSSNAEQTFILTWNDRINVRELNNFLQTSDRRRSSPIELLVLSACETAKGDNRATLGLAGVAVRAGARSTLATLWTVDDEATASLMSRFYQELAKGTVTKAAALRSAQQSILQNPRYRKLPYYWAPYVLVGNWL